MNTKEFEKLYEAERKKIDTLLLKTVKKRKPASLYEPAEYIVAGSGKRIRPLLVLLSCSALSDKFDLAYNAAVSVELLHNFTLVHDDIMDNAEKRRGRLTLHKKHDINTAILVGDSLLSIAYEFLLKDVNEKNYEIVSVFTQALIDVCEGQSLDKDFEIRKNVSLEDYLKMISLKTAALAKMCCTIGAILGGGNAKEVTALSAYGQNIGIAFQIQDDLLDITGKEEKFGKSIGGDLIEGKKTFLFLKALEKAKGSDKKLLQKVISNKGISSSEIQLYKNLYDKLGVINDAANEVERYTRKALNPLKILPEKYFKIFSWLAEALLNRTT